MAMTDAQLTALSTIAWILGTATTFILLAHWSAGGSWGIASAIARGVVGWTARNGVAAGQWPGDEVPPMESPELGLLWAGQPRNATHADSTALLDVSVDLPPLAEIEDLGSRHLA
jgi:hypothetical protein